MGPDYQAFSDELGKIAAAGKIPFSRSMSKLFQKRVGKSARIGTRPQSVATLLRRHAGGTFKHKLGESAVGLRDADLVPPKGKKHPGDVPSREGMEEEAKREDGRGNATTIHAPGINTALSPDVMNSPAQRN